MQRPYDQGTGIDRPPFPLPHKKASVFFSCPTFYRQLNEQEILGDKALTTLCRGVFILIAMLYEGAWN
jgi:hypothetical protein